MISNKINNSTTNKLNYNTNNKEDFVLELSKKYTNIKSCEIVGKCCYIFSYGDNEWYFDIYKRFNGKFRLFHKSSIKTKKFHIQREYSRIEHLFDSINNHESYIFKGQNRKSKLDKLFDMISSQNKQNNNKKVC